MTDIDLQAKVREALDSTNGNRHDAQKLLIAWAVRDHQMLLNMTKQHLKAIATALIECAERPPVPANTSQQADSKLSQKALVGILADDSNDHLVQDKRRRANLPPPKTTERQASAMRQLAEAYARKRDEN
ncbi:MAG: hypothetical protein ABTQ34_05925 [Bdellovibrionales bacterium]